MSIGERITQLRKQHNISQQQLAQMMDVSRQAVSKWENDLSSPDTIHLIRLADALGTDVEYLATGKASEPEVKEKVVTVIQQVDRIVEKPVVIQKIVEMEKPAQAPSRTVKKVVRTKYVRNPLEFIAVGILCFLMGFLMAWILF